MQIYEPSDDSYLFKEFLEEYFSNLQTPNSNLQYLDCGTGSGILAKTALKFLKPNQITALDINETAVKALQEEPFKTIHSNLFSKIPNPKSQIPNTFDLVTFNAPYLPFDPREPKDSQLATTGGKSGDEVSLKFLHQAKFHLNPNGKVFLLISSLTPQDKIKSLWPYKIAKRKKIFQEELLILEFKK